MKRKIILNDYYSLSKINELNKNNDYITLLLYLHRFINEIVFILKIYPDDLIKINSINNKINN